MFLLAVLVGGAFGAGDQYLGSLPSLGAWGAPVSLMSAPWLVLPFAFGATQVNARRGALAGLVASASALAAYFVMIMGPFEGGHSSFTATELKGLLLSNGLNLAGALVTGPLFGWLGHRWRTRRALSSAALVAGALLLEQPFLHLLAGSLRGLPEGAPLATSLAEAGAGVCLAAYFLLRHRQFRRACPAA